MPNQGETLVIGGGIIGLACAFFLHNQGKSVRVVHGVGLNESTSCGNAGGVAVAEIIPISGPGVIWKAPKWLVDPEGPLSIRTSYLPKLLPWFWKFLRSGTPQHRLRLTEAMAALLATAFDDHDHVLQTIGKAHFLQKNGTTFVYKSEHGRKAAQAEWDLRRACGVEFEPLDRAAVSHFEPALGPLADCGYRIENWAHYRDPGELVVALADYLASVGVSFEQAEVDQINKTMDKVTGVTLTTGKKISADQVVVATGAWSGRLSEQVGDPVLLESERGYNTTLPEPGVDVRSFVTFSEDFFVMTPMRMGLRIGGAVEFAGLQVPPNYRRSKALVALAQKYMPELNTSGGTEWMGHRPSTPDSVPVIGPSHSCSNLFYAFGHGHLGLTGSMTTGRLIADLVGGIPPSIDLSPFSINRFR